MTMAVHDTVAPDADAAPGRLKTFIKAGVQILFLVGGICIMYLPPVKEQLGRINEISLRLQAFGWAAPGIFMCSVAVLVAVGVPRLLLCPIGGAAFGFFQGLLWTQMGTIMGFYGAFLLVRWAGRDAILTRWPQLKRFTTLSRRNGIITVLLVRQLPITGFYINILLGMLPLSHLDFILGTAIGILPEAVPATLLGSHAVHISSKQSIMYSMLVVAAFIVVWAISGLLRGRRVRAAAFARELSPDPGMQQNSPAP